jgi:4'-phosphopantetheinyl transferase
VRSGTVSVYVTALPGAVGPELAACAEGVLSRAERQRVASLPAARRPEFLVGRMLARAVLGRCLGCSPADVRVAGTGGRPRLLGRDPIDFNLSHSPRHCAVAVMVGGRVGVDVEEVVDYRARMAGRWYSPREADWLARLPEPARAPGFCKLWTIKEACGKARGTGLRPPLDVVADPTADHGLAGELHWRTWWLSSSTVLTVAAACDDRAIAPSVVARPTIVDVPATIRSRP